MKDISAIRNRYSGYHYVLVGGDFYSEGGAWRSVYRFYKHLDQAGESVLLIDLRRSGGWKQWLCALIFARRIVVNGMAAVVCWPVLLGLAVRKHVAVYLHDTEYMLNALAKQRPLRYKILAWLLKSRLVLCVSKRMEELYRQRFGARNTWVVYELTQLVPEPVLDSTKMHIVMIGSLCRRKGYTLFVEVARRSAASGLPWEFHWVGGLAERDLAPVANQIHWWGWRDSATSILRQADAFFLSSIDDPQPLACLEALAFGKRAVVYAETGSAEIVNGLPGCRVFADHKPESAFAALQEALAEEPDAQAFEVALKKYAEVTAFEQRLEEAFGHNAQ